MMISDPFGLRSGLSGGGSGGSIDMSRGFSGLGNLPPLDWMPTPGSEYGVNVGAQFPWNVPDTLTYFRWYESVLFERAREADRRLLVANFAPVTRILLSGKFDEIQLDTSAAPRMFANGVEYELRDIGGFKVWLTANPFAPRSQGGQPTVPPRSMPDWLEQFGASTSLDANASAPSAPSATSSTSSPFETPPARDAHGKDLYGLLSWAPLSAPSASPFPPTWVPPASRMGVAPMPRTTGQAPGHSIAPPPPIRGGTSDALYFRPGYWQIHQTGMQEWQKDSPDWGKVVSGIVVSPLAYLEDGIVRPIMNIPNSVINKVITAGQHFDRASLWLQQDEWAEASADALEGVADLALAFLDVAALVEGLGLNSAASTGRRPALAQEIRASAPHELPRTALAEEIPASVPHELPRASVAGENPSMTSSANHSEFSSHPAIIDRLSRARQFDLGGFRSLTAKGKFGRRWDGLDCDEALHNAFVRHRRGKSRYDPMLADNPAIALSPELHRLIANLKSFEGRSAADVLRFHIDQMREFTPDFVLVVLERESLKFIKLHGL